MKETSMLYITTHADEIFKQNRWRDGLVCPYCGCKHVYQFKDGRYKCAECEHKFSDKTGTIFAHSKLSTAQILCFIYLMLDGKGMSSIEIAKKVGVTQKTAWYMCHRLRYAMDQSDISLTGTVTMDEVYLRGSWSNFPMYKKIQLLQAYGLWQTDKKDNFKDVKVHKVVNQYKTPVYGMNDGTSIVLTALPNDFASDCLSDIFNTHAHTCDLAVSDQSNYYFHWYKRTGVFNETNNHSKRIFKTESGHTSNPIEGTFANLKRQQLCNHVHIDKCHTQLYLNEFVFRWNHRHQSITDKMSALFEHINFTVTRKQILDFDPREYFETIHRKLSFRDMQRMFATGLFESITENRITYSKTDVERCIAMGLEYPI